MYVRVFTGLSEQKRPTFYVSVNLLVSGALGFVKGGNEENEWNPSAPCCLLPCLPKSQESQPHALLSQPLPCLPLSDVPSLFRQQAK